MRDDIKEVYEQTLEFEIDKHAEFEDFETHENAQVLEYLEDVVAKLKAVVEAQREEDYKFEKECEDFTGDENEN